MLNICISTPPTFGKKKSVIMQIFNLYPLGNIRFFSVFSNLNILNLINNNFNKYNLLILILYLL